MDKISFFNREQKCSPLKKRIIELCMNEDENSIAEISKQLNSSVPTITRMISELIEDGILIEKGKLDTNGGRRPIIYGLNPDAGYFVGVDVRKHHFSIIFMRFDGSIYDYVEDIPFLPVASVASVGELCALIKEQCAALDVPAEQIIAYGVNLTGRVNSRSGYSYSFFLGEENPLDEELSKQLGKPVYLENDSRAMTYGEYMTFHKNISNMLFMNLTWGLGMGMILNGKLIYGKSGFSGEIGHFPMMENNQICQCGKLGCLETAASGIALQRMLTEKMAAGRTSLLSRRYENGEEITMEDILHAINEEDVLAIECLEEIGRILGRAIAGLINLFNPELIVIGGNLSQAKDYLLIPVKGAINKHCLNMANRETKIVCSRLGKKAGPIGASLLSRSKMLDLI